MTLTEFLLARIAEDEDEARHLPPAPPPSSLPAGACFGCGTNLLAEAEAKRRIVEWASVKVVRFAPSLDTPPRFAEVTFCDGRVYSDPHCQVDVTDEYHRWAD